jgi:hypothetical protein
MTPTYALQSQSNGAQCVLKQAICRDIPTDVEATTRRNEIFTYDYGLGYNAVQFGESPTFRRNISRPSSVSKSKKVKFPVCLIS